MERVILTIQNLSKAVRLGLFKTRTKSEGQSVSQKNYPRVWSESAREKMSAHAKRRGLGGQNFGRQIIYNGIALDSSYELTVAQELDANAIDWTRPKNLPWVDDDAGDHRYYPDFYLPAYDVYLDPKNDYLIEQDARKIRLVEEQNQVKILVLSKDMLIWPVILRYIELRYK